MILYTIFSLASRGFIIFLLKCCNILQITFYNIFYYYKKPYLRRPVLTIIINDKHPYY